MSDWMVAIAAALGQCVLLDIDKSIVLSIVANIHLVAMDGPAKHCEEDLAPSRRD